MGSVLRAFSFCVISIAALSLLISALPHIDEPWAYEHDYNGALVSLAARNHLRFGLTTTRGLMHLGTTSDREGPFYLHHPPLVSWWTAAAFSLLDVREITARLAACMWPVLTLLVISIWLWKRGLVLAGAAAATTLAIVPLLRVFGRMPEPSGPALFFLTVAATQISPAARGGRRQTVILTAALLLASLSSWAGFLGSLVASVLMGFLCRRGQRHALAAAAPVLCFGAALFFLGLLSISAVGFQNLWEDARSIIEYRTGGGLPVSISKWLSRVLWNRPLRHLTFLWIPGMVVAIFYCLRAARRGLTEEPLGAALLLMTITGFLHILLFPVASWYHNYWHIFLTVPVAMGAGLLVDWIGRTRYPVRVVGILAFLGLSLVCLFRGDQLVDQKQEKPLMDLESFRAFSELENFLEPGERLAVAFKTQCRLPHPAFIPQFLYYLDRPLLSVENADDVRSLEVRWLLVPQLPGPEISEILNFLREREPKAVWGILSLYDLSKPERG